MYFHPCSCCVWIDNTIAFKLVLNEVAMFCQLNDNPSSIHLGCIYTCIFIWSSTTQPQTTHQKCILFPGVNGVQDICTQGIHVMLLVDDFLLKLNNVTGAQIQTFPKFKPLKLRRKSTIIKTSSLRKQILQSDFISCS